MALEVLHHDGVEPFHGLLAEVALRVVDRLAQGRPGSRHRLPAFRVHRHPPDQLVVLAEVDEAVIGELGHQGLGHMPQGPVELERPGEPVPDPLQQPDPVELTLVAAPHGLAGKDDDAVDRAGRVAQRRGLSPHEHPRSILPHVNEGTLPYEAAKYLFGQFCGFDKIGFIEAHLKDGMPY